MKNALYLCLFIFFPALATAQQPDSTKSESKRLCVSAGLTSIAYHIYYKEPQIPGDVTIGYFVPFALNIGYRLNQRASLQVGLAYGGSKDYGLWINTGASGKKIEYADASRTHAISVPVTARFIFFNVYKRFPIYGTATLMPAWGLTKYRITKTEEGADPVTINEKYTGINTFATAGIGFNYKISQRFSGYLEVLPFKYNMTGKNSYHHDWEQYAPRLRRLYKSLGFGVNYDL